MDKDKTTKEPIFVLGEELAYLKGRYGGWQKLAEKIQSVSLDGQTIHRHKLAKLAKSDPKVSLSINEIYLLDRFLKQINKGKGLAEVTLLRRQEDFASQLSDGKMNLLISTRFQKGSIGIDTASAWDVKAAAWMMSIGDTRKEIFPVHHWNNNLKENCKGRWCLHLNEAAHTISIGSPLGSISSDRILCNMLDISPFQKSPKQNMPIYFVVPKLRDLFFKKSSFTVDASSNSARQMGLPEEAYNLSDDERAYVLGDIVIKCPAIGTNFSCVIARRSPKSDQLFDVILAGLTGPTTFGAAHAILEGRLHYTLPLMTPKYRNQIFVAFIKMKVERWKDNLDERDNRKVVLESIEAKEEDMYILRRRESGDWQCIPAVE